MTNKQARNIANWIFHEAQRNTESGNWITYFDEIVEKYNNMHVITTAKAQMIVNWLYRLYKDAILDAVVEDDYIDITIGTWYYENDEDDDGEE